MSSHPNKEYYYALVDMGSNGIRFSITDLSTDTARVLPTVFQDRCGISLYDAQYSNGIKVPIPDPVIDDVLSALLHFKTTCRHFGVRDDRLRVVATEATRNAINSERFLERIEKHVGWKPELLPKEEEGRLGAMGVASSVSDLNGLVLDMGGGSVQITHVMKRSDGEVYMGPTGSISLPFGAAALMARMDTARTEEQHLSTLDDISSQIRTSLSTLQIPTQPKHDLYLSGGGLRGWGHLLMSQDPIQPYPIPLINGYHITSSTRFMPPALDPPTTLLAKPHGISKRRASQLPAVHTLLVALLRALHPSEINTVTFTQGGVREGLLYSLLPPPIRTQPPLTTATNPYAPPSSPHLLSLLRSATPAPPHILPPHLLTATTNLLHTHAPFPKDIRASSALRSTTSGLLAGTHGLLHSDRALLALVLCARWGGDVPPTDVEFCGKMQEVCSAEGRWWARFLGIVAGLVGDVFPAGVVVGEEEEGEGSLGFEARVEGGRVEIGIRVGRQGEEVVRRWAVELGKMGKRKNWVGGWGLEVRVGVEIVDGRSGGLRV